HAVGRRVDAAVPQRLGPVLRNRKRHTAGKVAQAVDAVDPLGVQGVETGAFLGQRGIAAVAAAGVPRHAEAVRVALEQCLLAFRQVFGMLLPVLPGNNKQRPVVGIGVGVGIAGLVAQPRRYAAQAAAPGRNAAVGVAGAFGADRR